MMIFFFFAGSPYSFTKLAKKKYKYSAYKCIFLHSQIICKEVKIEGVVMATFNGISAIDALRRLKEEKIKVVDIRDEQSFNTDHIKGSFHLTNANISRFMQDVDFETPVFIICYSGHGSKGVAQYLCDQGYTNMYSVDGGFGAWKIAGLNN
jgi:thiosulfate sulfurtransferase